MTVATLQSIAWPFLMVKKIIAVPIWHMQEFIYLIRSTTTHYLMLQPSHVYSPLQIVLLEVK